MLHNCRVRLGKCDIWRAGWQAGNAHPTGGISFSGKRPFCSKGFRLTGRS